VNNFQQADTGTKMIHIGKTPNRPSFQRYFCWTIQNSYRGLVKIGTTADNARNFSQCDSLLMGNNCGAHTPYIESKNPTAKIEHEATTVKLEDQVFYCNQRGIPTESHCFNC
jgi:Fe-S cluster assembly protein SufB